MAKKSKKRNGIELERPTIGGSIRKHPMKIVRGTVKGAVGGATVGGTVHLIFGTPAGLSIGVGAGAGGMAGAVDGAMDAHDMEVTVHNAAESLIKKMDGAFEEVEATIEKAGSVDVRELVGELRLAFVGEDTEDDEEDEKKSTKKSKKESSRQQARR